MKTIRVATLHAGKFNVICLFIKKRALLILIVMSLIVLSCSESDDLDPIANDPGIVKELPADDSPSNEKPPVDDDTFTDEDSTNDDETTADPDSVIIYTDIEPDFVGDDITDYYELDLNNDKIVDFVIGNSLHENWTWLGIIAIRNDGIISVEPWYTHTVPIEKNGEISFPVNDNIGQHYNSAGIIAIEECFGNEEGLGCSYDWARKGDRYIGLKIKINAQIHFGWVRMEVTSFTKWVIKDYAYNATPDKPILAGQME